MFAQHGEFSTFMVQSVIIGVQHAFVPSHVQQGILAIDKVFPHGRDGGQGQGDQPHLSILTHESNGTRQMVFETMGTVVRKLVRVALTHEGHVERIRRRKRHVLFFFFDEVVLVGPPFPLDHHSVFLPLKYLFYAKQGVVLQLHFFQISVVKGALHGVPIPLVNLVRGDGTAHHLMHQKHFLGPTWQVTFLKGTMHFVETDMIPHLKIGSDGFLFQPLAIQAFPNGFFVVPCHVLGSHPNGTMTGGIVTFHEWRQLILKPKGIGGCEIPIQSSFNVRLNRSTRAALAFPSVEKWWIPCFWVHCLNARL